MAADSLRWIRRLSERALPHLRPRSSGLLPRIVARAATLDTRTTPAKPLLRPSCHSVACRIWARVPPPRAIARHSRRCSRGRCRAACHGLSSGPIAGSHMYRASSARAGATDCECCDHCVRGRSTRCCSGRMVFVSSFRPGYRSAGSRSPSCVLCCNSLGIFWDGLCMSGVAKRGCGVIRRHSVGLPPVLDNRSEGTLGWRSRRPLATSRGYDTGSDFIRLDRLPGPPPQQTNIALYVGSSCGTDVRSRGAILSGMIGRHWSGCVGQACW